MKNPPSDNNFRLNMRLIITAFLFLFHLSAAASGYGWYVASFDWNALQQNRAAIDASVVAERKKDKSLLLSDAQNIVAVDYFRDEKNYKRLALVDESPEFEFYSVLMVEYAFKLQKKNQIPTFFALFESGRSLWSSAPADSFFVLSPDEVISFHQEVKSLNSKRRHPEQFREELAHLEQLLKKTAAQRRALQFDGHD